MASKQNNVTIPVVTPNHKAKLSDIQSDFVEQRRNRIKRGITPRNTMYVLQTLFR